MISLFGMLNENEGFRLSITNLYSFRLTRWLPHLPVILQQGSAQVHSLSALKLPQNKLGVPGDKFYCPRPPKASCIAVPIELHLLSLY